MYLLCICPSLHDYIRSRFHKKQTATIQATKVIPDLPATLSNCAISRQKHENRLTIKVSCFVSSLIKQFPLPTQYRPSPMTQYMLHSNASTTATQNHECYLMHLRNQNQRSQTGKHSLLCHISLLTARCQPTISTPSSIVPSVP